MLGLTNIAMKIDDGTLGWSSEAPFEAIIVTAGAPFVPEELATQLATGGRMVIPVGDRINQELVKLVKQGDGSLVSEQSVKCRFVNLIGKDGWQEI
jgi:protein-L-isoaspartate(D-aspartate) O-methyltransferase